MIPRHPDPEVIKSTLGTVVLTALALVLEKTREDLEAYRNDHPVFVADATKRGLANWIHDRMRAHAKETFATSPDVVIADKEPEFELQVFRDEVTFRVRLKKHDSLGAVASYPTQGALNFITQPEENLLTTLGLTEVNLCIGYEWDELAREMLSDLISLHDGSFKKALWVTELPTLVGGTIVPITPVGDGPVPPVIEIVADETAEEEREAGSE